ncbi:hypothetical protein LZ31DRAFT_248728 [Colletotrichum somersetense]|nr:hypothetical protein LZ31DRAFT_248728 [Colletotrichum somersetense]
MHHSRVAKRNKIDEAMLVVLNVCKSFPQIIFYTTHFIWHALSSSLVYMCVVFLDSYVVLSKARPAILLHQLPYQLAARPRSQAPPHFPTAHQRPPVSSASRRFC